MNKLFEVKVDPNREFNNIRNTKQPKKAYRDLIVHFVNHLDMLDFKEATGLVFSDKDTELWYDCKVSIRSKGLFSVEKKIIDYQPRTCAIWDDYMGMPQYVTSDMSGFHQILIHFKDEESLTDFLGKINQKITKDTKFIWYPQADKITRLDYIWESDVQPQFPIYIISKGRWETSYTVKNLEWMGIKNYYVIVEEQEYENYKMNLGEEHLLILDKKFQEEYDTCDPEGDEMGLPVGSGAARNFGWEHSIKNGYEWHWMMDDNIFAFYRLNENRAYRVKSGAFFRAMEDFVLRYNNISMAGPQYTKFIPYKEFRRPLEWNTRLYSCNLIRNDVPFRWRCRYNEDTDLSLRMLKAGYSTVQFVPFLQDKATTQTVKGGNTSEIYQVGTGVKSRALARLHPDVTEVVYKYHRIHHYVNYTKFRLNDPKPKNITLPKEGENEYDMKLVYTGATRNENIYNGRIKNE